MKGEPGIGKSTFVKKLIYDWARDIFVTFSLIFTISLKLVNSNDPIENMIIDQSPPLINENFQPATLKAILKQHEKILLILDGFDEMGENARESIYVKQLLLSELYGNTNLILTSRPQMTTDIEQYFTTVASIEGFSRENAEHFIERFFPNDPDTVQAIMDFTGRSGIRDMWRSPILLLFICVLVDSRSIDIGPSSNIPMSTIYDRLIECIFRRYFAKINQPKDKKELDQLIQEKVIKFGQIAFECLGDDSNLLASSYVTRIVGPEAFEYGLIIGEVDRTMVFCDPGDRKVSFLHRTLQEYLAAQFLVSKIKTEKYQLKTVLSEQVKRDPMGKYGLFSNFLNQMLEKAKVKTTVESTVVPTAEAEMQGIQTSSANEQTVDDPAEKEQRALFDISQQSLSSKKSVTITGYSVTPESSQFVMNVLKSNLSLVGLTFTNLDLSHCLRQLFASELPTLENMYFEHCVFQEDEQMVNAFLPMARENMFPSLWGFSLNQCNVSTQVAKIMGKVLQQCQKLGAFNATSCTFNNALSHFLEGNHGELFELWFSRCDFLESSEMANNILFATGQLRKVALQECTLDVGAYTLLGKCMSSSMQEVTLDVKCKEPHELKADIFNQELSSVTTITISNAKTRQLPNPSYMEKLTEFIGKTELTSASCSGSLPNVRNITFTDMILNSEIMRHLGHSLQYCQSPFTLKFDSCDIINGVGYLAENGLPTMHDIEFDHCNLIDTLDKPPVIQTGGFASLATLIKPSCNDRSRVLGGESLVNFGLSRGHISEQSIAVLCRAVSTSTTLSVLKIPMTSEALQVLIDKDLPVVNAMEFYVRNKDDEQSNAEIGFQDMSDKEIVTATGKRFNSLRVLHLFRDGKPTPFVQLPRNENEQPTMASLQSESWKQFFSSLAGNSSLTVCHFDLMDLTDSLALLLCEVLPSLSNLLINNCKIKESVTEFEKYNGNLPNVPQFRLESSPISDLDNCALRLLCTCLAGSKVLREFTISHSDHVSDLNIFTSKFSETPQVNFNNCLSALFSQPLAHLQKIQLISCVLDEEFSETVISNPHPVFLPRLTMLDFSDRQKSYKTTTISNSAMKVLSKVLAGSPHMKELCFKDVDCKDCLSLLLSKKFSHLKSFQFEGCILDENTSFDQIDFSQHLPSVTELDVTVGPWRLSKNRQVTNSAAQVLCESVGGSMKLSALNLSNIDLTDCLSLLLTDKMPRLSELALNGCTLSEDSVVDQEVVGYLPKLYDLNLKHCKHVSPSAAGMLLKAVSGSDVLTSISLTKVDLSALSSTLFTHDLPCLSHFSLEDCTLSNKQVGSFIQSRKEGFFPALRFLYLNGTKCMSGWFTRTSGQDTASVGSFEKGGFTSACQGLWVLAVKDCSLTKSDVEGLCNAAREGALKTLKQLAISKDEIHGVDLHGICRQAKMSLIH